jgi:hypothetical protein
MYTESVVVMNDPVVMPRLAIKGFTFGTENAVWTKTSISIVVGMGFVPAPNPAATSNEIWLPFTPVLSHVGSPAKIISRFVL